MESTLFTPVHESVHAKDTLRSLQPDQDHAETMKNTERVGKRMEHPEFRREFIEEFIPLVEAGNFEEAVECAYAEIKRVGTEGVDSYTVTLRHFVTDQEVLQFADKVLVESVYRFEKAHAIEYYKQLRTSTTSTAPPASTTTNIVQDPSHAPPEPWRRDILYNEAWQVCEAHVAVMLSKPTQADAAQPLLDAIQRELLRPPCPLHTTLLQLLHLDPSRCREMRSLANTLRQIQKRTGQALWEDLHPLRLALLLHHRVLSSHDLRHITRYRLTDAVNCMQDLCERSALAFDRVLSALPTKHAHADCALNDIPYRLSNLVSMDVKDLPPTRAPPTPAVTTATIAAATTTSVAVAASAATTTSTVTTSVTSHSRPATATPSTHDRSALLDAFRYDAQPSRVTALPTVAPHMPLNATLAAVVAHAHAAASCNKPEHSELRQCLAKVPLPPKQQLPKWYLYSILAVEPQPATHAEAKRWITLMPCLLTGSLEASPSPQRQALPTTVFTEALHSAMQAAGQSVITPQERWLPVILRQRPSRALKTRSQILKLWSHVLQRFRDVAAGKAGNAEDPWLTDLAGALARHGPACPSTLQREAAGDSRIPFHLRDALHIFFDDAHE